MSDQVNRAIAVVGVGAVLPDAPDAPAFWQNVTAGRYSITDVDPQRWDPELYYDPDPKAPDKTYSTIGGWVRDWNWDPLGWRLPIPPKVADAMDVAQIWAVIAAREALQDYGYPDRPLDADRVAVVLGNAMGGENQFVSALRVNYPEYARELERAPSFAALDPGLQATILAETRGRMSDRLPEITEDTMPGELANITAGRIANLFNFHGPNFTTDAACASAMAGFDAGIAGLESHAYDAVLTGGVDANMGASSFIKFCKIGALSATGTRPYADGADGFVMGEGASVFLLKRLTDAEKDGDRIYAVLRGLAGSSDGKGRGITAPNPVGQRFAVERAWRNANSIPDTASYIEGHGTSTKVGDVVEADALSAVFSKLGLPPGSLPLGSVKSNIGHLKAAAGAAGILKAVMALDAKVLPPSLNAERPNPNIDFERSPLFVNTELREWKASPSQVRQAGVSAFGFGGTNFHAVFEEYIPGRIRTGDRKVTYSLVAPEPTMSGVDTKAPLRGALVVGGETLDEVAARLRTIAGDAAAGNAPAPAPPAEGDLHAPFRIAIDYGDAAELEDRAAKAIKAVQADNAGMWKALRNQGVFSGEGSPELVAFLYPGQGSQYVNMLDTLRQIEPIVADVIAEADRAMEPILGGPLSDYMYADPADKAAYHAADAELRKTEITQPAVLTVDAALTRLLAAYGVRPDMVMGHSLGEYGALEATGALPFPDALEAVAGRGREMAQVDVPDPGLMAAVFAPLEVVEETLESIDGYVVIANLNSTKQAVIGGASAAVEEASQRLTSAGYMVVPIPVSHAFHTEIVASVSEPLQDLLRRLSLASPAVPLVANIDGEFYPMGPNVAPKMIDILGKQIASPVQFVKGLRTLYDAGCRVFVEVGPKKALHGFVEDVLGEDEDVIALFANHPKQGDVVSFNQALCGLYAAGVGSGTRSKTETTEIAASAAAAPDAAPADPAAEPVPAAPVAAAAPAAPRDASPDGEDTYVQLGHLLADFLERGYDIYRGQGSPEPAAPRPAAVPTRENAVVTGASLGLPGSDRVFTSDGVKRILAGEVLIDTIPVKLRQEMVDHRITRLHKSEAGGGHFAAIDSQADVVKLAGRGGEVDLVAEFGVPEERASVLDRTSTLAIGAGLEALRDAGIPLVLRYKTTTTGTKLPDRWMLPEAMRDDTGIIFACAFPGGDFTIAEANRFQQDQARHARLEELQTLRSRVDGSEDGNAALAAELDHRIHEVEAELEAHAYTFDRKYLFKALSMGHAQFAEYIGARGPNTQINGACASVPQAVAIAEDWIASGRCRRVVVISSDDVTSDISLPWIGSGFLAVGAAATDEVVEDAATPFDRRRHGMILGMGAAAVVVEGADAARSRGLAPIAEVLSTVTANSAFHGSRLDRDHIRFVMEKLIVQAEERWGIDRHQIAPSTVFVSHETYTPARGGSAQAEVDALRYVFGDSADHIVVTNTKGFTGHAMATGIEDVVAIKTIETAIVPPIPNFKVPDPDLGHLNLSKGGVYPARYALRLGAGFGSQISLTLYRYVDSPLGRHPEPDELGFDYRIDDTAAWNSWLRQISGYGAPELEFEGRTLRVRDAGPPNFVEPAAPASRPAVAAAPAPTPVAPKIEPAPAVPPAPTTPTAPAPVAAAPPAPAAPDAVVVEAVPMGDPVHDRVLDIVAAETGYPPDMLDLDLDLEADLGIDTVKQAEMFAAIRDEWGIERDDNVALRDYPTLQHVIDFVYERTDLQPAAPAAGLTPTAPAPVAAAPPAPAAAVVEAVPMGDPVHDRVLDIVAAETGYPPDMLDLDLDLEADLGIDTVKQAEMFAAIRDEWGIERDDNVALRDYPTLQHVIDFVYERTDLQPAAPAAGLTPTAPAPVAAAPPAPAAAVVEAVPMGDPVHDRVLDIVAAETGYPPDMLDLDLDLEADLGIDTVKQAEMFAAIRDEWGIERDDNVALRDYPTLQHVIDFVYERTDLQPAAPAAGLTPTAPAPVAAAPPAPAAAVVEAVPMGDPVHDRVLDIVAAETGYPPDMLDLDLDLEADLGIDTVKQAEMFAAIRDEWGIERDDNVALRDYPTLQHVIDFVYERTDLQPAAPAAGLTPTAPAPVAAAPPAPAAPPEPLPVEAPDLIRGDDEAAAAIPRRVPGAVLRPALEHTRATGIELGEGSRVVVMADTGGIGKALVKRLEERGVDVLFIGDAPNADDLLGRIDTWAADGPVTGVYWLPALDREDPITEMTLDDWREALRARVKLLYRTMRHLYDRVGEAGTFLVSATRLGGRHGYDGIGPVAPMGGAVTGFTKTYKREKPDALVKAVDFAPSRKTAALADALVAETLHDPGAVEIGVADDLRWTVGLTEVALPDDPSGLDLDSDSVFVVTGAAGSIVSAITADLASASHGVFHLLDLVPEPDPADPDITAFGDDKDALKRTIFERLKASGERATPAMVDKELAGIERAHAALSAIRAVESAGGTVHYHSVNLLDADAMAAVTDQIVADSSRVDVLLHAGGLEISKLLPDKEPGEYDLVFDVKADGWFNLLHGLREVPIATTVSFSSIAGRFGNAGQADYSAANDLLCKSSLGISAVRRETTGIAIDWTAWGDIGMATRGSIPTVMKAAGIDMLPAAAGIPIVRREITGTSGNREMLVGLRLGMLLEEWHEDGGMDVDVANERTPESVMAGRVTSFGVNDGLTMVTRLDPKEQPFLNDHRIDGTPVLPGVMGVEAFAAAARAGFPDRAVGAIEAVAFSAPFKFYRDEPRDVTVTAQFRTDGDEIVADCRIIGERTLASQPEPQVTVHFTGRVRLGTAPPDLGNAPVPSEDEPVVTAPDIYRIYFHGPAYQVLDEAWRTNGSVAGRFAEGLPPNNEPPNLDTITAPRLLELCFQTAGVWEIGTSDQMALPMHVERVATAIDAAAAEATFAVVVPMDDGAFNATVVDDSGNVLVRMDGYLTVPLPAPLDDEAVAPLRTAMLPDD